MDNAKPWANRRLARPGLVRRLEVALVWLWGGFGVALVEPWWSLGGALVEPWCGFGVALVWPWCGFVLRSLCLVYAYYMALRWLWVASPRLKRSGVRDTSRKSENSVIMRIAVYEQHEQMGKNSTC